MSESDPYQDGQDSIGHLTVCKVDGCERCEWLMEFYMACDTCGHWGHQDSTGWVLRRGVPFCSDKCADDRFGGIADEQSATHTKKDSE